MSVIYCRGDITKVTKVAPFWDTEFTTEDTERTEKNEARIKGNRGLRGGRGYFSGKAKTFRFELLQAARWRWLPIGMDDGRGGTALAKGGLERAPRFSFNGTNAAMEVW